MFTLGTYRTILRRTRNLCAVIVGTRTGEANDTPGSEKGPSDATGGLRCSAEPAM